MSGRRKVHEWWEVQWSKGADGGVLRFDNRVDAHRNAGPQRWSSGVRTKVVHVTRWAVGRERGRA